MRLVVLIFAALVVGVVSANPQVLKPTATPPPADGDVVRISTNLIQVDVTVVDKNGKTVRDLRPDEIEIYENGEKQKITGFTFISSVREVSGKPKIDKDAVPVPPTEIKAENVRRTFTLIVDDLALSFESAYHTRRALRKFVDEQMQDGDLVAIIRTGAGIGALQQFTSDKRILHAAIERVKWNPIGSGGVGAFAPLEAVSPTDPDAPEPEAGERTAEGIEREFNDFRESYFASGTLGAINFVVRGMSELPGRKSIILFSDGFSLSNVDASGFTEGSMILDALRGLIENANRASVVIYAVDPRGLQYTGLTATDNTGGRTGEQVSSAMTARRNKLVDTQDGLRYLTKETGGFAVVNSNDLNGGVRRIMDDQSYYLIAYEPDADTFDPVKRKFNRLTVRVIRSGATVRYRSGFFNVADRELPTTTVAQTPAQRIQTALTSPFAVGGISLRLNALFGSDAVKGPYVRSLLHVDAKDLKLVDDKDGAKKTTIDILAASFGDNGLVIDQLGKSYTLTIQAKNLARFVEYGFVYDFTFPVKKAGAYQYRVAIRDVEGESVGSASQFIEVPELKKNRLTVSSIVLQNLTVRQWELMADPNAGRVATDSLGDTALRRAKTGTILRYGYEIYNAKLDGSKKPSLSTRIRVFRDGKLVLDGKAVSFDVAGQTDVQHLKMSGALSLGGKMLPGDYILQVIVTDALAKANQQIATQFVQFEIVE